MKTLILGVSAFVLCGVSFADKNPPKPAPAPAPACGISGGGACANPGARCTMNGIAGLCGSKGGKCTCDTLKKPGFLDFENGSSR